MDSRAFLVENASVLKRLAGLFFSRAVRIKRITWESGCVTLDILLPGAQTLTCMVKPRSDSDPHFMQTNLLNLSYAGSSIDPKGAVLVEDLAARLSGLNFGQLVARLQEEPHTPLIGQGEGPGEAAPAQHAHAVRSAASGWGSELADQFLAEDMREGSSVRFTCDLTLIMHGEFECNFVHADLPYYREIPFVESPWPNIPYPRRPCGRTDWTGSPRPRQKISFYCSDLCEADAVTGSNRKLYGIVEQAALNKGAGLCHFNATCVPTITGDDVQWAVSRYQKHCAVPVFYVTRSRTSAYLDIIEMMKKKASASRSGTARPKRRAVNLVGYADDEFPPDLGKYLQDLKITINAAMLPQFDWRDLERWAKAGIQILRPHESFRDFYEHFFESLPLSTLKPEAPYGPERTRAWFEAIAEATGRREALEEAWPRWWAPHAREWEAMVEEASRCTLAFALRLPQIRKLGDSWKNHSVPVFQLIEEMGFNTAILVGTEGAEPETVRREADALCRSMLSRPPASLQLFESAEQLRHLLHHGDPSAFYSEFSFDRRLTAAGLNRFSTRGFSMGLAGAVRTLRRLLATCRLPFYRRYKKFFPLQARDYEP